MAPSTNASKKTVAASGKTARQSGVKKGNSLGLDDLDPVVQPSQSSSDDGMMATIAQQMQASMEKRKKEREARFLQAAQTEFSRLVCPYVETHRAEQPSSVFFELSEKAHVLQDGVAEIDKIHADFQDAYAVNEDNIRKLWNAILEEQLKLHALIDQKYKSTIDGEKRREKDHIQALAHCRKACEESQRLIDSLSPL